MWNLWARAICGATPCQAWMQSWKKSGFLLPGRNCGSTFFPNARGGKCPTIDCVQSFNRNTINENQGCLNFSVETRLSRLYPIVPDCDSILYLQSMYNRRQSETIHYNPDSILDCTCSHRLSLDWMSFTIRLQSIQSSNNKITIKNENNNN